MQKTEKLARECDDLRRMLKSGSLHIKFTARSDMHIDVQRNLERPEELEFAAGDSVSLYSNGSLRLQHPEWQMRAQSSDGFGNHIG